MCCIGCFFGKKWGAYLLLNYKMARFLTCWIWSRNPVMSKLDWRGQDGRQRTGCLGAIRSRIGNSSQIKSKDFRDGSLGVVLMITAWSMFWGWGGLQTPLSGRTSNAQPPLFSAWAKKPMSSMAVGAQRLPLLFRISASCPVPAPGQGCYGVIVRASLWNCTDVFTSLLAS